MSESGPDSWPSPEDMRRCLEETAREAGPGMLSEAISALAGLHIQWYRAWQEAGAPEHRAAEWTGILVTESFRTPS